MSEDLSENTEQRQKSPFAGMWCLACSVACFLFVFPLAMYAGVEVYLVILAVGLLFLIGAFVIGGKYTRWLGAFWALLVLSSICG
jgi:hypothetical protein